MEQRTKPPAGRSHAKKRDTKRDKNRSTSENRSSGSRNSSSENLKRIFVKGYTTASGRVVPDHYRSTPYVDDAPKGTFIERRLINPPKRTRH
ncbi:MAG: hypothetical protein LBV38_07250 [Alistipes sp.]|jgi:hypothetical protein|nr:hypothetical protein [Alistipes sp.]